MCEADHISECKHRKLSSKYNGKKVKMIKKEQYFQSAMEMEHEKQSCITFQCLSKVQVPQILTSEQYFTFHH